MMTWKWQCRKFPVIVSSNDQTLLNRRQSMDLLMKTCSLIFCQEKGGKSMLSSIIPTILGSGRSQILAIWLGHLQGCIPSKEQQRRLSGSSYYEQHGHGARRHAEGARQPVFRQGNGQDHPQDFCCCITFRQHLELTQSDTTDEESDSLLWYWRV